MIQKLLKGTVVPVAGYLVNAINYVKDTHIWSVGRKMSSGMEYLGMNLMSGEKVNCLINCRPLPKIQRR